MSECVISIILQASFKQMEYLQSREMHINDQKPNDIRLNVLAIQEDSRH